MQQHKIISFLDAIQYDYDKSVISHLNENFNDKLILKYVFNYTNTKTILKDINKVLENRMKDLNTVFKKTISDDDYLNNYNLYLKYDESNSDYYDYASSLMQEINNNPFLLTKQKQIMQMVCDSYVDWFKLNEKYVDFMMYEPLSDLNQKLLDYLKNNHQFLVKFYIKQKQIKDASIIKNLLNDPNFDVINHLKDEYPQHYEKLINEIKFSLLIKSDLEYLKETINNLDFNKILDLDSYSFHKFNQTYSKVLFYKHQFDKMNQPQFYWNWYFEDEIKNNEWLEIKLKGLYENNFITNTDAIDKMIVLYETYNELNDENKSKYTYDKSTSLNNNIKHLKSVLLKQQEKITENEFKDEKNDIFKDFDLELEMLLTPKNLTIKRILNRHDSIALGEKMDVCLARGFYDNQLLNHEYSLYQVSSKNDPDEICGLMIQYSKSSNKIKFNQINSYYNSFKLQQKWESLIYDEVQQTIKKINKKLNKGLDKDEY